MTRVLKFLDSSDHDLDLWIIANKLCLPKKLSSLNWIEFFYFYTWDFPVVSIAINFSMLEEF